MVSGISIFFPCLSIQLYYLFINHMEASVKVHGWKGFQSFHVKERENNEWPNLICMGQPKVNWSLQDPRVLPGLRSISPNFRWVVDKIYIFKLQHILV